MKETAFDVLMFMFDNYLHNDELIADSEELEAELTQAGFERNHIHLAFNWLEGLAEEPQFEFVQQPLSQRIFSAEENERLDAESRGLLYSMEANRLLKPVQREQVIDRLLALDDPEIDIEQTKWVLLMVLFNQPGEEEAFACIEQLVMDEPLGVYH